MPINPNALSSSPEPDETPPSQAAADAVSGVTNEQEGAAPTRKRRTKAEMIADAVVPTDDQMVEIKDSGTGAKVMRTWAEAVPLVKAEKAEWVDKTMKYALLKVQQKEAAPAFEPTPDLGTQSGKSVDATDESGMRIAPEGADLGDEVVVGSETYVVGHGGKLVQGMIEKDGVPVIPQRRWQRELGGGLEGKWESTPLSQPTVPVEQAEEKLAVERSTPKTETLPAGVEIEQISQGVWKVGTGVLEKIGLPDYSSLQIGPISASRTVMDDGNRTTVQIGNRTAEIPTAVVAVAHEAMDIVEYIARYQRGDLVSFLESTGALKQPVS